MQHTSDAELLRMGGGTSGQSPRGQSSRNSNHGNGHSTEPEKRGIFASSKKVALVAGLGALSWISTYAGMLELIQANMGDVDLVMKIAIGGSVAMLMLMIIWLLDQLFDENNAVAIRVVYGLGYVFLALISIGFSFGFYWKFLESRTEASRSAESAITQVQAALTGAETRLSQLQGSLEGLAAISAQKAADEVSTGRSCPNSRPGDGPRRRLRESDAANLTLASQFVKGRAAVIRKDIASLGGDIQKIAKQDKSTFDPATGTRNEFMRALSRKLDLTISGFNSFRSDPQLKQFRADFAERSEKTVFPDEQGKTFVCPDAQLQTGLRGGVKAIDALPALVKPEIAVVEGAEATIEAFRRLLVTMTSLARFKLPATPDDIRAEQQKAIQSLGAGAPAVIVSEEAAGLGKRDWVPLLIAVFVDICLLLVSIPPALSAAERTRRRRQSATGDGYRTIADLSAIHDDEDTLKQLEPLRHIAFDHWGHDYVAVPMIASGGAIQPAPKHDPASWWSYLSGRDQEPEAPVKLSEKDVWEAQFLANLFASHERHGPFKRVFGRFVPVRKKLRSLGSKWQTVQTFRLYRFKKGAWSDFVLDMIVGAERALAPVRDAQDQARLAKVESKSQEIVHAVEFKQSEFQAKLDEQRGVAETRRKMRDLAAEHEQLKIDIEKEKLENERQKLRSKLARQVAVDAEEFESYVPGQDRDPDGLMVKTRRERTQRQGETNPEIVALMQSISQQALATQEIARQQTVFMQEVTRTLATLSRGPQPVANASELPHVQAAHGNRAQGNGVHSFAAAYAQREPSLDAARTAHRAEARPASEAPMVIPLHGERNESRFAGDAADHEAFNGAPHYPHAQFHGNAAVAIAPVLKPASNSLSALQSFNYGLSRLMGRPDRRDPDRRDDGSASVSNGYAAMVHPGMRSLDDRPIEPMVRDAIDVSGAAMNHAKAEERHWSEDGAQGFTLPEPVALSELRSRGRRDDADAPATGTSWNGGWVNDSESSSPVQVDAFVEAVRAGQAADPSGEMSHEGSDAAAHWSENQATAEAHQAAGPQLDFPDGIDADPADHGGLSLDNIGAIANRFGQHTVSRRRRH